MALSFNYAATLKETRANPAARTSFLCEQADKGENDLAAIRPCNFVHDERRSLPNWLDHVRQPGRPRGQGLFRLGGDGGDVAGSAYAARESLDTL